MWKIWKKIKSSTGHSNVDKEAMQGINDWFNYWFKEAREFFLRKESLLVLKYKWSLVVLILNETKWLRWMWNPDRLGPKIYQVNSPHSQVGQQGGANFPPNTLQKTIYGLPGSHLRKKHVEALGPPPNLQPLPSIYVCPFALQLCRNMIRSSDLQNSF